MSNERKDEKAEENERLLEAYRHQDVMHPSIILRKVVGNGHDMAEDDLSVVSFDMTRADENIDSKVSKDFHWAVSSLKMLRKSYAKMLSEPIEKIHLDGIVQNNTYLILEDKGYMLASNIKNADRVSGACGLINNHVAIFFVNENLKSTTLLHESVHHSDLRLYERHFSNFPIYQTAIMIIDAQRSETGERNKSVRCLRTVHQDYKPGELYKEGLAWISAMPLATLANEKNHCAKNLKILHSLYTKAILEGNYAVMACFEHFKPSKTLQVLLNSYNMKGQQVGQNRRQILKQEKNFVNELLLFRKSIDEIARSGLAHEKVPQSVFDVCEKCGLNASTDVVNAYLHAKRLFNETKDDAKKMLTTLKKCQNNLDMHQKSSGNLKDFVIAYMYVQLAQNVSDGKEFVVCDQNFSGKTSEEIKTAMNNELCDQIAVFEVLGQKGDMLQDCRLAYGLEIKPEYVGAVRQVVDRDFNKAENLTERMKLISTWIKSFENTRLVSEKKKSQVKAAIGMERILAETFGNSRLHGALSRQDLKDFSVSKAILNDLAYMETDDEKDGLPLSLYKDFDLGVVSDLCSRDKTCFDKESRAYKPNNYQSRSEKGTLYARALYEFLKLRHQTDVKQLPELELTCFNPDSNIRLWYRQSELTHIAKSIRNLADGR